MNIINKRFVYSGSLCPILWILSVISVVGQDNPFKEPIPPTPNAASLGKYGDIPVSLHTGVPNITIPIYTLQEGPLSIPISLSYHSAGIKVEETASWVGLGWALNAGGMVTRTVVGGPDEGRNDYQNAYTYLGGYGWFKDGGLPEEILACSGAPSNPTPEPGMCSSCSCLEFFLDVANGAIDIEPDIYTFNVSGYTGKFVFDTAGQVLQIPKSDVRIDPDYDFVNDVIKGWTIRTPDGTKYEFGGPDATETNYTDPTGVYAGFANQFFSGTTWYLKRTLSPNEDYSIQFNYETERFGFGGRVSQSFVVPTSSCTPQGDVGDAPTYLLYNSVDSRRLTSITTSSGFTIINFIPSDQVRDDLGRWDNQFGLNDEARHLKRIEISGIGFCKKFSLDHSYFLSSENSGYPNYPAHPGDDRKRLKLKSVQESACDDTESIPPFKFYYDETPLPRRYSLARDHWGYYNGAVQNQSLIPPVTYICGNLITQGTALRDPVFSKMTAGILREIHYPTGGFTAFEYEPHQEQGKPDIIGGLRLKRKTDYDGVGGQPVSVDYQYFDGRLYSRVVEYVSYPNQSTWGLTYGVDFGVLVRSSPKPALQSTQGYHIGYGRVEERYYHEGKISRTFNNVIPTISFGFPDAPEIARVGAAAENSTSLCDSLGYATKVTTTLFDYGMQENFNARKVVIVNCKPAGQSSPCPAPYAFYVDYTVVTSRFRPLRQNTTIDEVSSVVQFSYNPDDLHDNPVEVVTINSNGDVHKSMKQYPLDSGVSVPLLMVQRNMINPVVDEVNYVNNSRIAHRRNYFTQLGTNVNLTRITKYSTTSDNDSASLEIQYSITGKVIKTQNSFKAPTSYIWGYNDKIPIARILNANPEEIYYNGFENSGVIGDAKTGDKYFPGMTFTIPISEQPTPTGLKMSYWYFDGNNWLYSGEMDYNSSISHAGALRIDEFRVYPPGAHMTTYAYNLGVGIATLTDPNGLATTYEYDELSRLYRVIDSDGNILQQHEYQYPTEN